MDKSTNLETEVMLNRIIFKKDNFQIVSFEIIEGEQKGYIITAKGNAPSLDYGMKYHLIAKPIEDPKYGKQYQILSINSNYDLKDAQEQKKFLSFFLTSIQMKNLFDTYSDPIEILEKRDIEALCKIKGISTAKALRLIEAYEDNKDNSLAYIKLHDYGLTKHAIDKLVKTYGSSELLIDKVTTNPYILIDEVDGYGWSKADSIALNSGTPPTSKFRLCAFAKYYLNKSAQDNGHTWISLQELRNAYYDVIPEATDQDVRDALKVLSEPLFNNAPELIYYPETDRICLSKYKTLEENICKELFRIQSGQNLQYKKSDFEDIKNSIQELQGWDFTEEQLEASQMILDNPVSIVTGAAGCVDCDTEFFNGEKWKKISEWEQGDKVLQYNKDGSAELVQPLRYIKEKCDKFWHIFSEKGIDQCISDDHTSILIQNGEWKEMPTKEFIKMMQEIPDISLGKTPVLFTYGGKGIDLTDEQIKLMCAVICDGSFYSKSLPHQDSYLTCRFHIKKDRKKLALVELFKENNIEYSTTKSAAEGYTDYYIDSPRREKVFTDYWYNCSNRQLQIICDNIIQWDGHITKKGSLQFSTSIKENADFVQFAFSSCGYKAQIYTFDRRGKVRVVNGKEYPYKSIEYRVNITRNGDVNYPAYNYKSKFTGVEEYQSKDGFKYCFTVPSGYLILRRKGIAGIQHNCGKTSSLQLSTTILQHSQTYSIAQTALSGRAAARMSEITGLPGFTMHRLLKMNPEDGVPKHDKANPLPYNIIILDEVSMVDGYIFLKLLRAIPTGAKLVMLGDIHQLESIGLCNLLKDMIASNKLPYKKLEKIHRQAANSGILTTATLIRQGEQIIPSIIWEGETQVGELKDLTLIGLTGNTYTQEVILDNYKKLLNRGVSKDDIDVIVPMRKRGDICLNTLNRKIQDIVANKSFNSITISNKKIDEDGEGITIYENDKVIITENCYTGIIDAEGEEVPVFNGNIGKVVSIPEAGDEIIVNLYQQGEVTIPRSAFKILNLGYAITCHAKQGSEIPYAVVGIDSSCYALMSREWLYTALTRAKKECILVGQNTILSKAVQISSISKKQTWLCELLQCKQQP